MMSILLWHSTTQSLKRLSTHKIPAQHTYRKKPICNSPAAKRCPRYTKGITTLLHFSQLCLIHTTPTGSPSCGGDAAVYVFDINQPSLSTPFYSVLVSVCVFMAFSTVFHSINSPDNSPLSHSVLLVLFLPNWSFWCITLHESLPQPRYPLWLTGLKAPTN